MPDKKECFFIRIAATDYADYSKGYTVWDTEVGSMIYTWTARTSAGLKSSLVKHWIIRNILVATDGEGLSHGHTTWKLWPCTYRYFENGNSPGTNRIARIFVARP